tara:strand:- start:134 stop:1474 length:1341 start_codon:yes stop_codon:yes gene_type:complete
MSIQDRRNFLQKSSLGIDNIRKSVTKLGEGLSSLSVKTSQLLKQTRQNNELKRKLIRQDAEFFKRRRENALRKQREDELEASTITGVTKRQGSLIQKSTRGFLGRILDFIGILLLGWAITNLPKIIAAFQKLFGLIKRVVGVLTSFVEGMKNFLIGIGTGIDNFLSIFQRFNFAEDDKNIRDTIDEGEANLNKLNKDFKESVQNFINDKDIANAENVAKDIGVLEDNEDEINANINSSLTPQDQGDTEEDQETFSADEVEILNQGGEIPGDVEAAAFSPVTDEDIERELLLDQELESEGVKGTQTLSEEDIEEALIGATGDEGGGEEKQENITPEQSTTSGASVTASPTLTAEFDLEPEEGYANIEGMFDPVGSSNKSSSITPVRKTRKELRSRKRKRQTIVKVNNQGGDMSTPTLSSDSDSTTIIVGNNSQKTLLDLQSLNNKHN